MTAPHPDQVEITLIGPGYGECAVVHLGNGSWVVIDSCIDSETGKPAAVDYLESLGLSPEQAVVEIIATHWHDDHIRGMADLLSHCQNAKFCMSTALGKKEFIAMVSAYDQQLFTRATSGVREIHRVFEILSRRGQHPRHAVASRSVYFLQASQSGHGEACTVTTLSPSDAQIEKFYNEISALMPEVKKTKQRCTPQGPNHLAVVIWIAIGPVALLLGSDLEETINPDTGWSVIVNSRTRPQGRASVIKVPHHGSSTAHNADVWEQMLIPAPFALLTPFSRGKVLPDSLDVERLSTLTPNGFATAKVGKKKSKRRPRAVEKTLREADITIRQAEPPTGFVRLRNGGVGNFSDWAVELNGGACQFSELYT